MNRDTPPPERRRSERLSTHTRSRDTSRHTSTRDPNRYTAVATRRGHERSRDPNRYTAVATRRESERSRDTDRDSAVATRRSMERTQRRHVGEPSSSAVAMETTKKKGGKSTWLWDVGGRLVESRFLTAEQRSEEKEEAEDEEWILSHDNALPLIRSHRPLPINFPEFPECGSREEIEEWHRETTIAYENAAHDPVSNPPILRERKGKGTKGMKMKTPSVEVFSIEQKEMVFKLSSSIVSISSISIGNDKEIPNWKFTGIVIGPSKSDDYVRILTSSKTICDYDGQLLNRKLLVRLQNKTIRDGELMFFDPYYDIAVLEILVDKPFQCPSFVSSPEYGEKVFILARSEDSALLTVTGKVMCHNESYLDRNYYLYVNCLLPENSTFGFVMDRDGYVAGLAFFVGWSKTAVLPSFIVKTLVEMERNFRCIARPILGLCLRAVQFLDIHKREEILYEHNIHNGYIVDEVEVDSTTEIVGIRDGDVIVSFNGMRSLTMPQLEGYLLSLGWKFLERKSELSKVILKLKVHDPIKGKEYNINLPLGFSCFHSVRQSSSTSTKRKETSTMLMPSGRVLRPRGN